MIKKYPALQFLEFSYSQFGTPVIDKTSIRVPVRDLGVYEGFPGQDQFQFYEQSVLIFEGVVSSKREITDDSTGFAVTQTINDGPFLGHTREVFSFEFEAHCYEHPNPYASVYVVWWIIAETVRFEVI